jgi:hypothetical protein
MIQLIEPKLVDASELEPGQVGVCIRENGIAIDLKVWKGAPECMRDAIIAHEQGHQIDPKKQHWIIDEIQAHWYSVRRYPLGVFVNLLHFLITPARWGFYHKRIDEKR